MPITPFHFGPGALLHSAAPRQVSFLAFCAANVLIDVESLYNLVARKYPVHAFLHTYVGATLIVGLTFLLFVGGRMMARRYWIPDAFCWRGLTCKQVVLGAALGAYTHILLDSVMHQDIRPLAPFSVDNALLGIVPLGTLHIACIALGFAGLAVVGARWLLRNRMGVQEREL